MNPTDLLMYLSGADDQGLYAQADAVRRETFGKATYLHVAVQLSNVCDQACRHCALRGENSRLRRFRLSATQVLDQAAEAIRGGAGTVVLRVGNDPAWTAPLVSELVREIKVRHDVAVALSLGHRGLDEYAYWKECGADRCRINLETSEPFQFKRLRQGEHFTGRLHLLGKLHELGYEVGSGVLAGLPGTTPMDSLRDVLFLAELDLDMIEITPFVPRPDTPMGGMGPGSVDAAMRMAALLRLLCPTACIPATDALDELRPGSRQLALGRGCNAVLPVVGTPLSRLDADPLPEGLGSIRAAIVRSGLIPSPAKGLVQEGRHVG
jgi:biotin synthase